MIQLDPEIEQPYVFLGRMLDQSEDKRPRITELFAGLAKRRPEDAVATFLYGKALEAEDPARAVALLRKSVALNDASWESHFELGGMRVDIDLRGINL